MKKLWLITLTLVMAVMLCFGLSACGTLDQLENEFGATIEGGGFKKGSTLNLNEITVTEEKGTEILEQLAKGGISINDETKAYIYDIFVTDKKNVEVQPDGAVKVTIPAPADEQAEGYNVYHIKDSGVIENIPATLANGKITFETDSFSTYVIVPQYNVYTFYWNTQVTLELAKGGKVQLDGTEYTEITTVAITPQSIVTLKAIPDEGYKFAGWVINAEGAETTTAAEAEYEYTMPYNNVKITASFTPVITALDITNFGSFFVYNPATLTDAEEISIENFINNAEPGKEYLVTGIIQSVQRNRMVIRDENGKRITVQPDRSIDSEAFYAEFKNKISHFVAVSGVKENIAFQDMLVNATFPSFKADFKKAYVRGEVLTGMIKLTEGKDYEIISDVDWNKKGEYTVTYRLIENNDVSYTVTVFVVGETVEFGAYVEGGTLIYEGIDIGPDFWKEYNEGFGKLTFNAQGEPNTVFKGWYTDEDTPKLISTSSTYTFRFDTDTRVVAVFEHIPTGLALDGHNAGFNTNENETVILLPSTRTYDVNNILVYKIVNGEPKWLEPGTYTVDAGGFNGTNPAKGTYVLTFSYQGIVFTHTVRVVDPADMAYFYASSQAGGMVECNKSYGEYTKGEQITVTVLLRSEKDYEFLGWYVADASGAVGTTCLSTDITYTVTLNANTYIIAKIEPKITRLEVEGYEGEPTRIHQSKFWLADREIKVFACGALGKKVELTANDYTVDFGGLNLNNPAVGKYTVTYTYKKDTSVTYSVVVWVYNEDHSFLAINNSPESGKLLFEGELTNEAGGQYVDGEEITVSAVSNEGYIFRYWDCLVYDQATGVCESKIVSTDATYTFTINEDTQIYAVFDRDVIGLELRDSQGQIVNAVTVYAGIISPVIDHYDLYAITTTGALWIGNSSDYSMYDFGGFDTSNPVVGTYTITVTYVSAGKPTNITTTLTVTVIKAPCYVNVHAEGGYVEFNGVRGSDISEEVEDSTPITMKAIVADPQHRMFLGWYGYDYETDRWVLLGTDTTFTTVVTQDTKILARFGAIVNGIQLHQQTSIHDKGVENIFVESQGIWNDELSSYACNGEIVIYANSSYANDIAGIFENFNIIACDTNGRHTKIDASDLVIDLGDYKAEEGYYEVTVTYGSFTIEFRVFVLPAQG